MEQQNSFSGWARVEMMGHNVLVGYVTTKYFGPAALFQVDVPCADEREETLDSPEFVGGEWCPAGSVIKREAIPAASPMIGPTTIYRLTPCTEEVARESLKKRVGRAYAVVSMPEGRKSLPMPPDEDEYGDIAQVGDDEDDEI